MSKDVLRKLPSVDRLLSHADAEMLLHDFGHNLTVEAIRSTLDHTRRSILNEAITQIPQDTDLLTEARNLLDSWIAPTLHHVINATGVIIHTNLGRAPLSDSALEAVTTVGGQYNTLEFNLEDGKRGSRSTHAEDLLRRITGVEAAFVVNNNAAAVLLALSALAGQTGTYPQGRGCVISRGQLVEIGGGFRMPDVMAQSGAQLVEVGTTNRTHLRDFENAIDESTALFMRVHRSNFDIIGFTTEPTLQELVELAHQHNLLFIDDLGSGALFDTTRYGLAPEPTIQDSLEAGVDLLMFSGDKLLGGPQAGILLGKESVIARLKHHPLARAVRPDKLCLSALSATLLHYLKGDAEAAIPIWQMISMSIEELESRAAHWQQKLSSAGLSCTIEDNHSVVGGGSLPGQYLSTKVLKIVNDSPDASARKLREHNPPVIVRHEDDHLIIDPRTVLPRQEDSLLAALAALA